MERAGRRRALRASIICYKLPEAYYAQPPGQQLSRDPVRASSVQVTMATTSKKHACGNGGALATKKSDHLSRRNASSMSTVYLKCLARGDLSCGGWQSLKKASDIRRVQAFLKLLFSFFFSFCKLLRHKDRSSNFLINRSITSSIINTVLKIAALGVAARLPCKQSR